MSNATKDESNDLFEFNQNGSNSSTVVKHTDNKEDIKQPTRRIVQKIKIERKADRENEYNIKDKHEQINLFDEVLLGEEKLDHTNQSDEQIITPLPNTRIKRDVQDEEVMIIDLKNNSKLRKKQEINKKQDRRNIKNKKKVSNKNIKSQDKKKRKKKKVKKKISKKMKIIKWTSIISIFIGLSIYTLLSPLFNVLTITVEGNVKISETEILSLSQMLIDQNIFSYNLEEIKTNIKQNAYIESVKVVRNFPDNITLEIEERKSSYLIMIGAGYGYISNQGYVLDISNSNLDLPIITGYTTELENLRIGNRLNVDDLVKLGDVLKIVESAQNNDLLGEITYIDITDTTNYILELEKYNKTVHLGDTTNLSTKMLLILKFIEVEGDTKGEIILNMNLNNEKNKPYFRKDFSTEEVV